jgi:predicted dehydrogenase
MRFGIVGLGWAATAFHAPALSRAKGATLVGGADSSAEQRESWSSATGTPAFATLEELVEEARPDVVTIATPPDSHAELCVQALDLGAHVFCEKPFVSNLDEADRVLAAAEAAGRRVAVNHEYREKPIFKALRDEIGSAEAGRLVFCQIWQLMDMPPWDEPVSWRAAMPNRTLFEGGVHLVDLLLTLVGEPPTAVYARHTSGLEERRSADAIHLVTFEFPDGRLAQITINRLCRAGTRYVEVRADCERASLRASLGGRSVVQIGKKRAERTGIRLDLASGGLAWMERGLSRRTLARNPRQSGMHGTAALIERIVPALREGSEPPSNGREARQLVAVIEAAYRSAETGARIELQPATAESPAV